jgi:acyl-CoA dehydrogenase
MSELRRSYVTRWVFKQLRAALPKLSDTEREALEAGNVWWDAELFTGDPDWSILRNTHKPILSDAEQAFVDGPVNELCRMLDDWKVNWEEGDLPREVWDFLRQHKFFGMIIAKQYGGLEFSAFAHSEVVRKISTRSTVAAVTAMVPNSLGPGELLVQFGTTKQKDYWLPRLASGKEIPCFGLTSEDAGSDASAMQDSGIVCKGEFDGEEVLGLKLNWHKRYITLGPVATVLGLAFKCYDPDHLIGDQEDLGITAALIPTNLPGINIGRRHLPALQMFQNGPNWGKDVFIPLSFVIGGQQNVGKGWAMLMSALAAGRGISLPALSAAGAALSARTTGSYARVRDQFGLPVSKFEGVQIRLAQLIGRAYRLDAARKLTCAGLDEGFKPSVVSAIMKSNCTYALRDSVNDAMDVHAGKAVIDGPLNYIGNMNRSIPVAITVEGANIMTRHLIIYGQGAIRCHPFLLDEMLALEKDDEKQALVEFDAIFWKHFRHTLKTAVRAFVRSWSGAWISPAPDVPELKRYYQKLSRYAAALALVSDIALVSLGGALKRKEMLSARLGDVLSELYMLSSVLKRWEDEGRHTEDLPVVQYCMQTGLHHLENRLAEFFENFPGWTLSFIMRLLTMPFGKTQRAPSDRLISQCAQLLSEPSGTRERISAGLFLGVEGADKDGVSLLETAYALVIESAPIKKKMKKAKVETAAQALTDKLITKVEAKLLDKTDVAVGAVIEVDDFDQDAFRRNDVESESTQAYLRRGASE